MGKVIKFPFKAQPRFDLKKVRRRRNIDLEKFGQLNLFSDQPPEKETKVVRLHANLSLFEEALLLDNQGNKKASEWYRRAISAGDCVADAYCNLGILEYQNGDKVKAIDFFSNALKHDSRHFEAHYNLANLYFDANNLQLAKLHYEVAAQIQPDFYNIYYNLSIVNAMSGELENALDKLLKFKQLAPPEEHRNADALLSRIKLSIGNS